MANLMIELPDDLARTLALIAAQQHTSVQQLALDRLRSLAESWHGTSTWFASCPPSSNARAASSECGRR